MHNTVPLLKITVTSTLTQLWHCGKLRHDDAMSEIAERLESRANGTKHASVNEERLSWD